MEQTDLTYRLRNTGFTVEQIAWALLDEVFGTGKDVKDSQVIEIIDATRLSDNQEALKLAAALQLLITRGLVVKFSEQGVYCRTLEGRKIDTEDKMLESVGDAEALSKKVASLHARFTEVLAKSSLDAATDIIQDTVWACVGWGIAAVILVAIVVGTLSYILVSQRLTPRGTPITAMDTRFLEEAVLRLALLTIVGTRNSSGPWFGG